MKKFYLILIVLLSACSAQLAAPTATSTPEATATATPTPLPTATATVTLVPTLPPTEAVNNMEKYDIIFTDAQTVNVQGVEMTASTNVMKEAKIYGVSELRINPDVLAKLNARVMHVLFAPEEEDTQANADAFMKACKNGEQFSRTITAYTTDGGMTPKEITITPDCGNGVPEGMVGIGGVSWNFSKLFEEPSEQSGGVFTAPKDMPWIDVIVKGSGSSAGFMINEKNGKLEVFMGYGVATNPNRMSEQSAERVEIALDYLHAFPKKLDLKNTNDQFYDAQAWNGAVRVK